MGRCYGEQLRSSTLTVDQEIPYQQNIEGLSLALIIIKTSSNDINDLRPMMPEVLQALAAIQPSQVVQLNA